VREEGDTIIIPIVEEVLTIERRLVLKEEVRIRRIRETERYQERVTLRKQQAVVNRLPVENSAAAGGG
jgi:stress response protein YsnF